MEEKTSYSTEENTSLLARVGKKKLIAGAVVFVFIFSALVVGGRFLSSRLGRQPETLVTDSEPSVTAPPSFTADPTTIPSSTISPTPVSSPEVPQMFQMAPAECSYWCEDLLAYNSDWEQLSSSELTDGELDVPQSVYFLVKGETDCEDDITQARLKFEDESANAWRYSSDEPPAGVASDCDDGTYTCFYWEIEFTEAKCYFAESEVCVNDNCR